MSFSNILATTRRLVTDVKGVTAIEYGVIGALVIVASVAAITLMGTKLTTAFTSVATAL